MIDRRFAPYTATFLRVSVGVVALAHGLLRVFDYTGTVALFDSLGLTAFVASATITIVVGGGIALIAGVNTRYAAAVTTPILIGSIMITHW